MIQLQIALYNTGGCVAQKIHCLYLVHRFFLQHSLINPLFYYSFSAYLMSDCNGSSEKYKEFCKQAFSYLEINTIQKSTKIDFFSCSFQDSAIIIKSVHRNFLT